VHGALGGANAVDQYYHYATRVNLREPVFDPNEPPVKYVIRGRYVNVFPELTNQKQSKSDVGGEDSDTATTSAKSKWRSCDVIDTSESDDQRISDGLTVRVGELGCSEPELYSTGLSVIDSLSLPTNGLTTVYHVSAV